MKLSMNMLAQQLSDKDIFLHLNEHSNKRYRGVRSYKTENAFYVCGSGNNSYIYGESKDSYILLKNVSQSDALNEVMDILDDLNEKFEKMIKALQNKDYQCVVDICFEILKNPVFIMAANNKLIAINSQTSAEELNNPEWKHLYEYGYSSVQNYQRFKKIFRIQELEANTKPTLYSSPPTSDRTSIMVSMLCFDKTVFGRITLMEYFKKFSRGDYDFLEVIANTISDYMKITSMAFSEQEYNDVVTDLIYNDTDISEDKSKLIMDYFDWQKNDMHRVLVIGCKGLSEQLNLIKEYADNFFPNSPCTIYDNDIVIILKENRLLNNDEFVNKIKNTYLMKLNLSFGLSLEFDGLNKLKCYYNQAVYALNEGKKENKQICFFYEYAVKFILNSQSNEEKIKASHPDILKVIKNFGGIDCEDVNTLYSYLINERNLVKTSEDLAIHRNTLLYRVNKLKDLMKYDINEPYTREYMHLSLMGIKNYNEKYSPSKI